jgi:hypothetical protein
VEVRAKELAMIGYLVNLVIGLALTAVAVAVGGAILWGGYWVSDLAYAAGLWPVGAILRVALFVALICLGCGVLAMLWGVITGQAERRGAAIRAYRDYGRASTEADLLIARAEAVRLLNDVQQVIDEAMESSGDEHPYTWNLDRQELPRLAKAKRIRMTDICDERTIHELYLPREIAGSSPK